MWQEILCGVLLVMATDTVQAGLLVVPISKKVAIEWTGPWSEGVDYRKGDGVEYQGSSYLCLSGHTSSSVDAPPAAGYWDLMAAKGEPGTVIADMRCPDSDYVVGFSSGVPLCYSDLTDRLVFVSQATVTGDIGGLAAADAICQDEADTAGLGGKYMAFLSDVAEESNSVYWVRANASEMAYRRVDSVVVADDTAGFLSLSHLAPINLTAEGVAISGDTRVWTGYIAADGEIAPASGPEANCSEWTDATPWTAGGSYGYATATDVGWVNYYGTYCTEYHHIYCVRVPAAAAR